MSYIYLILSFNSASLCYKKKNQTNPNLSEVAQGLGKGVVILLRYMYLANVAG